MRICGVGDNVVDKYLHIDTLFPGGNALNVAVFARRRGAEAAYLGIIGDDEAGRLVRSSLAAEGVEFPRAKDGAYTAYARVSLDAGGNRVFVGSLPPPEALSLDAGDLAYLAGFDVLHTGDWSQTEGQIAELAAAAPVSFDFGSKPDGYEVPLIGHVRYATFSRPDLTPAQGGRFAEAMRARGPEVVIVTHGARGSTIAWNGEVHHEPAHAADVRDSLGAGDAYLAAALVAIHEGLELRAVAASAAGFAAAVCSHLGAFGYGAPLDGADCG